MNITRPRITNLALNEIPVFGSNLAGTHHTGFPHRMKRDYGAADGIFEGLSGCCYALPVRDTENRWLPLADIDAAIGRFLAHAKEHKLWQFSVTHVAGRAEGHTAREIAPLFFQHGPLPKNVSLPLEFWQAVGVSVQSPVSLHP